MMSDTERRARQAERMRRYRREHPDAQLRQRLRDAVSLLRRYGYDVVLAVPGLDALAASSFHSDAEAGETR